MLCRNPYMLGGTPIGCGQCLPCRVNKRRQWMWRQYLESLCHEENCFVTLTYNDENLPYCGNLEKDVVPRTIRFLRRRLGSKSIRYFYVGEYGDQTQRPHYHISLFGVSAHSIREVRTESGGSLAVAFPDLLAAAWVNSDNQPLGYYKIDEFNELTAQYVAGYVVKKLTHYSDPRLDGRVPEFAGMSRRPGLGIPAMAIIAKSLCESGHGMALIEDTGDVPHELRIGRRRIPLSRLLLRKLREAVGFTPEYIAKLKGGLSYEQSIQLLSLFADKEVTKGQDPRLITRRSVYLQSIEGKLAQTEARSKLWKKRNTL